MASSAVNRLAALSAQVGSETAGTCSYLDKADAEYEKYRFERVYANNPLDRYPAKIAKPTSIQEVVDATNYARKNNLKIGVRSGGHCHNAPSVREGNLLIDLFHLNELKWDATTETVVASPSSTGRMLQEFLKPYNRWFPGGHCADVALGGFMSQGGAGIMWRNVGWAASIIKWMDVVTADGKVVRSSPQENYDLLWSFIGGGHGYFATVVRFGLRCLPIYKYNLRTSLIFPGSKYRQLAQWMLDVADSVAPPTEFYMIAVRRKKFLPGGDPDETILVMNCATWMDDEKNAIDSLKFINECPYIEHAYQKAINEPVTIEAEYAVQDSISFKGSYYITNGWIAGANDKQVDLLEEAFTTVPTYESNTILFSCHPHGPGSKHHFANDITAGTYAFSYTVADDSDPDPAAARLKCIDWVQKVWGEIDRKSGLAEASGDPSAARTRGYYTGDANMEVRPGRFMSETNWAAWTGIRAKWDPNRRFVGYLHNPKNPINWNAWEGVPPEGRPS